MTERTERRIAAVAEEREDGEWREFVQWKAGYDLTRELIAAGVPDDLIESETAAIFALA